MSFISKKQEKLVLISSIFIMVTIFNVGVYAENKMNYESGGKFEDSATQSTEVMVNQISEIGNTNINETDNVNAEKNNEKSQKNSNDVMKIATYVIAAAALVGGSLLSRSKSSKAKQSSNGQGENLLNGLKQNLSPNGSNENKYLSQIEKESIANQYINDLQGRLPQKNGLWISADERAEILFEINRVSAKKYIIGADGYLLEDHKQGIDIKKSKTASMIIDKLIKGNNTTIVGVSSNISKFDSKTGNIKNQEIIDGISIGDKDIGHLVLVSNVSNSALILLHEMAHATESGQSALEIENIIRSELNLKARKIDQVENEDMFFNNFSEGEGFLDDFTKELGVTSSVGPSEDISIVEYKGTKAEFKNGVDGTYYEPDTSKVVVRKKQFRFKLNLDIGAGDVYLRNYVEKLGGTIEWVESESKALIKINGKEYSLKLKDPMVRNVNDRMVLSKENADRLLKVDELANDRKTVEDGYSYNKTYEEDYSSKGQYDFVENKTSSQSVSKDDLEESSDSSQDKTTKSMAPKTAPKPVRTPTPTPSPSPSPSPSSSTSHVQKNFNLLEDEISYNNKYKSELQAFNNDNISDMTLLMTGSAFLKKVLPNTTMIKKESDVDSYKGFISGIKECLEENGFDIEKTCIIEEESEEANKGAIYLSRVVLNKKSEERKNLFVMVSNDLSSISEFKNSDIVIKEAKKYGKAIGTSILNQIHLSGFIGSFKTLIDILAKEDTYKKKINIMQKHTQRLAQIYKALSDKEINLSDLICKVREDGEYFVIEMWEWEINIIIKSGLVSGKEAVLLVKLSAVTI